MDEVVLNHLQSLKQ